MVNEELIQQTLKKVLVFDLETSAHYSNGEEVDIKTKFNDYVQRARIKFFGAYSYLFNKYYLLEFKSNKEKIKKLLEAHDILVGFNSEDFDYPILKNNNVIPQETTEYIDYETWKKVIQEKKFIHIDMMVVLGDAVYITKSGYGYKQRGKLMGYKFNNNSLRHMAEVMGIKARKGDIDYRVFNKEEWNEQELKEIYEYLKSDIDVTKQLFEKTVEFWKPFTEFITDEDIVNLSWVKSSIASLTYKSACKVKGVKPTFAEKRNTSIREMGGRVLQPVVEEAYNCFIVDASSLYPHDMVMFNLFKEVDKNTPGAWNGNDLFKTKGYYDVSEQCVLAKAVQERLKERIRLKHEDPNNPMIYALKIFLNGLYGITSSEVFEQVYSPNIGWDTCYLSQQIIILAENMMREFGFETIGSDTDSLMLRAMKEEHNNKEYLQSCVDKVVKKILDNVPFPVDTFNFVIENECPYMMFPFSEQPLKDENGNTIKKNNRVVKKRQSKKKNYLYLFKKPNGELGLKIKGLPIIKDNATDLGKFILEKLLKPLIMKRKRAKFKRSEIELMLKKVLEKKGNVVLLAREFKVKKASFYKNDSQLQAQISKEYFGGNSGVIRLIKNRKVGRVGKSMKYASIEEILNSNVNISDLDLVKVRNELEPFVEEEKNGSYTLF